MLKVRAIAGIGIGAGVLASLFLILGRGFPALFLVLVHAGIVGGIAPIWIRREPWPSGIPNWMDVGLAGASALFTLLAGIFDSIPVFWLAQILGTIPAFRLAWAPYKIKGAPRWLIRSAQAQMALVIVLSVLLTVLYGQRGFNEMFASLSRTMGWAEPVAVVADSPMPVSTGAPVPMTGPVATVAGRAITEEMVRFQMQIDREGAPDQAADRVQSLSCLLLAYAELAVLEKRDKTAADKKRLWDEDAELRARIRDKTSLDRLRDSVGPEMFFDVYIGANGFYSRCLREMFERTAREKLREEADKILRLIKPKEGVPADLEQLTGIHPMTLYYSTQRRDFITEIELEIEDVQKPDPRDSLPAELNKLGVYHALPKPILLDRLGMIVRRTTSDSKMRKRYDVLKLKREDDYNAWFRQESRGVPIVIMDQKLRDQIAAVAASVRHLIQN